MAGKRNVELYTRGWRRPRSLVCLQTFDNSCSTAVHYKATARTAFDRFTGHQIQTKQNRLNMLSGHLSRHSQYLIGEWKGRPHLLRLNALPVNVTEEGVRHHIHRAVAARLGGR